MSVVAWVQQLGVCYIKGGRKSSSIHVILARSLQKAVQDVFEVIQRSKKYLQHNTSIPTHSAHREAPGQWRCEDQKSAAAHGTAPGGKMDGGSFDQGGQLSWLQLTRQLPRGYPFQLQGCKDSAWLHLRHTSWVSVQYQSHHITAVGELPCTLGT